MKKISINISSFIISCSSLLFINCENDPLNTEVIPVGEVPGIEIKVSEEDANKPGNRQDFVFVNDGGIVDDSALPPKLIVLAGSKIEFSGTAPLDRVVKRVWNIPQPEGIDDASLNIEQIVQTENFETITRSFSRANNTLAGVEQTGFPIVLTETLIDGTVNRLFNQLEIRRAVTPDFALPTRSSRNTPIIVRAADRADLGLEAADIRMPGQVVLNWDFGPEPIVVVESTQLTLTDNTFTTTNLNESFSVTYPEFIDDQPISLQVIRNFPVRSGDGDPLTGVPPIIKTKMISIVEGLSPNGGSGKDPVKLTSDGSKIFVRYTEEIANPEILEISDFSLEIENLNEAPAEIVSAINISEVNVDSSNGNVIELVLSSDIPSSLMDNVKLNYSNVDLSSVTGKAILSFDVPVDVVPTGSNLLAGSSNFEDEASWSNGGFFFPAPADSEELSFSTEQAFDGETSFLFETTETDLTGAGPVPSNGGIGAEIEDHNALGFASADTADYILSFWVYVEKTDADSSIDYFLLDFAAFTTGSKISELPLGEWTKVSGVRSITPGGDTRSLIRVVNSVNSNTGNVKVFVDQAEIRIVDDGR